MSNPREYHFFECDCTGHALVVSRDEDGVELAIWERNWPNAPNLRARFRNAWRVFRRASLDADTVILDPEKVEKLTLLLGGLS